VCVARAGVDAARSGAVGDGSSTVALRPAA
jgi:hypothetical protein